MLVGSKCLRVRWRQMRWCIEIENSSGLVCRLIESMCDCHKKNCNVSVVMVPQGHGQRASIVTSVLDDTGTSSHGNVLIAVQVFPWIEHIRDTVLFFRLHSNMVEHMWEREPSEQKVPGSTYHNRTWWQVRCKDKVVASFVWWILRCRWGSNQATVPRSYQRSGSAT